MESTNNKDTTEVTKQATLVPVSETNPESTSKSTPTTTSDSTDSSENNKKKKEPAPKVKFSQLFRYATKLDIFMTTAGCIAGAAAGCIFPLFSIVFGQMLNLFNSPNVAEQINLYAGYFLGIAVGGGVLTFLEIALPMISAERQIRRIRQEYIRALLRQDIGYHDVHAAGEVASRLVEDTILMSGGMGDKLATTFQHIFSFIAGLAVGFSKSWALTLTVLAVTPFLVIVVGFLKVATQGFEAAAAASYAKAGDCCSQAFASVRAIASFGGEALEVAKYDSHLQAAELAGIKKGRVMAGVVGAMFFLMYALYGVAMYVGSQLILTSRQENQICRTNPMADGCFSGGAVIQVFMSILIGAFAIGQAGPNFASMASAQAAAYSIFETIDSTPKIDYTRKGLIPTTPLKGKIEFRNVTFAYPSRPTEIILKKFNLTIEAGQMVALVGESGSGKSTIVALMERFYDPLEGQILLDDVNIQEYDLPWLRERMGYVQQDPLLFGVSVQENIANGKTGVIAATEEEISAAAVAANAADFISRLPKGYQTIVGTSVSSAQLSGGQRQRLCIARAIIRDPKILLLDEATSALDSESEAVVQASIDRILSDAGKSRTTIVIAHRLSTIVNANVIVVMRKGEIIESGSHTELMNKTDGMYKHLRSLQEVGGSGGGGGGASSSSSSAVSITSALKSATADASAPTSTSDSTTTTTMTNPMYSKKVFSDASSSTSTKVSSAKTSSTIKKKKKMIKTADGQEIEDDGDDDDDALLDLPPVPLSRVWALQADEWPRIAVALFGSVVGGCVQPAFAIVYSNMINLFFTPSDEALSEGVKDYVGYFFGFAGLIFLATWIRISMFVYLGEKLTRRLRTMAYRSMLRQEIAWFDEPRNSSGRLNARLAGDAALVRGATGESLSQLVQAGGACIAALIIAFVASWRLALVCCILIPLMVIGALHQNASFKGYDKGSGKALEDAGHVATEAMTAIRLVTAYNLQANTQTAFARALQGPMKDGLKKALVAGSGQGYSQLIMFTSYSLAFYAGGQFVSQGTLDFASLMRVFLAITMGAQAIGSAFSWGPDRQKAMRAVRSIFSIIDRKSLVDPMPGIAPEAEATAECSMNPSFAVEGKIEFQNVSFAYPSRPDFPVLENFNLTIEPGKTVAIVGESGSGKSTLVALLERFYDATKGNILLDGASILTIPVPDLRAQMALVQQEPALFSDSIAYNIGYGRKGAGNKEAPEKGVAVDKQQQKQEEGVDAEKSEKKTKTTSNKQLEEDTSSAVAPSPVYTDIAKVPADIIQAAKDANAHTFISEFQSGYATHCGSRGSLLSGGQKQRLAISRAIIRDPAILLLDEATSALDTHSEAVVQAALDRLLQGGKAEDGKDETPLKKRTTLVIAHRLSTVKNADAIVVLNRGKIMEVGSHDELMAKPQGYYRKLAQTQDQGSSSAAVPSV